MAAIDWANVTVSMTDLLKKRYEVKRVKQMLRSFDDDDLFARIFDNRKTALEQRLAAREAEYQLIHDKLQAQFGSYAFNQFYEKIVREYEEERVKVEFDNLTREIQRGTLGCDFCAHAPAANAEDHCKKFGEAPPLFQPECQFFTSAKESPSK